MKLGDTLTFIVQNDGTIVNRFLIVRYSMSGHKSHTLYGYDPDENERNFLEEYQIDGESTPDEEVEAAKQKIRFYVGEDADIEMFD